MKKLIFFFGTRPEAIKLCPLILELKKCESLDTVICVTGQHKEMLHQVLDVFKIKPDYNLEIMRDNQTLSDITINVLAKVGDVLDKEKPDLAIVHGDTTTTFATALSCFYKNIDVAHVEAGLRTDNIRNPFPEEYNRRVVSLISKYDFCPTETSRNNLLSEGKDGSHLYITGNTGIDALKYTVSNNYTSDIKKWADGYRLILMTAHRRENLGKPMESMFSAIRKVVDENQDIKVVYPVHLNPRVREIANRYFGGVDRIKLIEPLDVIAFHNLMNLSYLILTDSGGIQEEAPSLGKPVLVMRETTERPEGVEAGTLKLVGTTEKGIYDAFTNLLNNKDEYRRMSDIKNPYGDGNSSAIIREILEKELLGDSKE